MISIIAAIGKNNELGLNNKLLWSLPDDLKNFRTLTIGRTIIMGRKTFESIGRALPNRRNIVITRDLNYQKEGIEVSNSLSQALALIGKDTEEDIFIIGGGEIYKEALPLADKLYITRVDGTFEADTFFPEIKETEWKKIKAEIHPKDIEHLYNFIFEEYVKKQKPS